MRLSRLCSVVALVPLFSLVLGSACSSDSTPADVGDAAVDAPLEDTGKDASSIDSGSDSGARDAGIDAASTDSGADTGTPSDAGTTLPTRKGQCLTDAQCGSGMTCAATAPGGLCNGCAAACSLPGADQCNFGACNASCTVDNDCPTGLRCNSGGTCVLKSCSSDATCSPLHRCDGGFCRRIPCGAGVACPSGTTCKATSAGQLCIENNLTFP